MVLEFGFEFFSPIHVGVSEVKSADTHSESCHDVGCKGIFVHIVTVIERVPIEEDVFMNSLTVEGSEDVDAGSILPSDDTHRGVSSRPVHLDAIIIR